MRLTTLRYLKSISIIAATISLNAPMAQAANWVSEENRGWVWVDKDSVHRDGRLIVFNQGVGKAFNTPPNPGTPRAIDCVTGMLYERDAKGAWDMQHWMMPVSDWPHPLLCTE